MVRLHGGPLTYFRVIPAFIVITGCPFESTGTIHYDARKYPARCWILRCVMRRIDVVVDAPSYVMPHRRTLRVQHMASGADRSGRVSTTPNYGNVSVCSESLHEERVGTRKVSASGDQVANEIFATTERPVASRNMRRQYRTVVIGDDIGNTTST